MCSDLGKRFYLYSLMLAILMQGRLILKLILVQYPRSMSKTIRHLLQSLPAMLHCFHVPAWVIEEDGCLGVIKVNVLWKSINTQARTPQGLYAANRRKASAVLVVFVHWSPLETHHWGMRCELIMWESQHVMKYQTSRKKSGV